MINSGGKSGWATARALISLSHLNMHRTALPMVKACMPNSTRGRVVSPIACAVLMPDMPSSESPPTVGGLA